MILRQRHTREGGFQWNLLLDSRLRGNDEVVIIEFRLVKPAYMNQFDWTIL
jgi:hypothetical protein